MPLANFTTLRLIEDPAEARAPRSAAGPESFYQRLKRFVRRRVASEHDAADVVQEAYVRLVAAARETPVRNPAAFLHTAALNLVRDHARASLVRRSVQGDISDEIPCAAPSAERALSDREQLRVLERALLELKPKPRAALALYRFGDLSHAEIAGKLGVSVSMVEKYIKRALDHCRKRLAEANDHG